MVERLFLAVPRGCLQFVIVVFPYYTHLLFFSDVRNVFDATQQCENGGRTKYCRFDVSTYYLGVNCFQNSFNCYNLKSRTWDKQVMWMGYPSPVPYFRGDCS